MYRKMDFSSSKSRKGSRLTNVSIERESDERAFDVGLELLAVQSFSLNSLRNRAIHMGLPTRKVCCEKM